jgi:hypothetical protein
MSLEVAMDKYLSLEERIGSLKYGIWKEKLFAN